MISQQLGGDPATQTFTNRLSVMGIQRASVSAGKNQISCGISALDEFLEGGLPVGEVTEWGVPLGRGGREVLLSWLTAHHHTKAAADWCLWVYSKAHLTINPPAWSARGVCLSHTRFACSSRPLVDLKPVFMDPLFRVIVLDSPSSFTEEDCAFMARRARVNGQVILLLRDFFLSPTRGNVWTKLRLNCWLDHSAEQYQLQVIRGLSPRQLSLNADVLNERNIAKELVHARSNRNKSLQALK